MSPQVRSSGFAGAEVPVDEVRQVRSAHVGDGRAHLGTPAVDGVQSVVRHEPLDPLVVDAMATELVGHARAAGGVVEVVVDLVDLVDQTGLVPLASKDPAERASQSQEAEVDTRLLHRPLDREPFGLHGGDVPVAAHRSNPFTQKATLRLSRSRSVVRRFTSRRSLASSCSSVLSPSRSPRSTRSWRTQLPECLLDQAELSDHVGDRAVLVDHQGGRASAELLWVPNPTPGRLRLLLGHRRHDYPLFGDLVRANGGMVKLQVSDLQKAALTVVAVLRGRGPGRISPLLGASPHGPALADWRAQDPQRRWSGAMGSPVDQAFARAFCSIGTGRSSSITATSGRSTAVSSSSTARPKRSPDSTGPGCRWRS